DKDKNQLLERGTPAEQIPHIESELAVAESNLTNYQQRLKVLQQQKEQLTVTSPIEGKVVTFKLEDKISIDRPIKEGQLLLTIADLSQPWELEVHMAEDRMGHIRRAQQEQHKDDLGVNYILAGDPGRTLHGTVKQIQEEAEVEGDEGNTVLVKVTIDK